MGGEVLEIIRLTYPVDQKFHSNEPHVMALGFFDGVHLGHQSLLMKAKRIAEQKKVAFTAMTFDPHPDELIKKEKDRKYLTPLPIKAEIMRKLGVDKLFVMTFDKAFASLPPADFVDNYILEMQAIHVVVGFDFTFGLKAKGNTYYLQTMSEYKAFDVTVVSKKTYNNEKISSTLLRRLIRDGDVNLVPYYLGNHYEIRGQLGHLNVHQTEATNIYFDDKYILPRPGAYHVEIRNGKDAFEGVFKRPSSPEESCEISFPTTVKWNGDPRQTFSITFLNQIPSFSTVLV